MSHSSKLFKAQKRKASVVSLGDEAPVEKKEVKREKKKKAKSNQRKGEKIAAKSMTPDPQPQPFFTNNRRFFNYTTHNVILRPRRQRNGILAHQKLPAQRRADMGQGAALH
ncbi:hypothetical protein SNOG_14565 [Parastagonospora nodorum SN15]|uniref:Uncharacterized protein n=1 Tax=Phaeosphaeria nodorum (strain SN15 / ATCC MYA-4574 / FGSC 10173) TaxID=321614 RepID=Q0U156_PHANO|nr:hypothetical protein SNOG_14565 [Parastagonospora nodorum SN15]EAT78105.2 hypothetical protein SNOG_14565 [Parastagonospora nodorum SN15]